MAAMPTRMLLEEKLADGEVEVFLTEKRSEETLGIFIDVILLLVAVTLYALVQGENSLWGHYFKMFK